MWWFLANLDFLAMVVGGCSWLASCCWVVMGGWLWWWIGLWCFYYSEMDYFIIVDILFYCVES